MATPAQTISTTPNGQAPDRNPYALERAQAMAKAMTKRGPRCSRAYVTNMNVSAAIPKMVTGSMSRMIGAARTYARFSAVCSSSGA
jgi:hypothetical protein